MFHVKLQGTFPAKSSKTSCVLPTKKHQLPRSFLAMADWHTMGIDLPAFEVDFFFFAGEQCWMNINVFKTIRI